MMIITATVNTYFGSKVILPGTGVVMPVHFFYKNPRHQAPLEALGASGKEIPR